MTTHVFIVNSNTFKYHISYMFAGTGVKDKYIDFNNNKETKLHYAVENNLLGMIADCSRIRIGDLVLFYLQQKSSEGIKEGKFYGVFKVKKKLFLDNNDEKQFLKQELVKSLTFRILIEPYQVYSQGVSEWEALDEIKYIKSPNQMLWSLIYRKLKGNRGNTMITVYESERLINLIRNKNKRIALSGNSFTFNKVNQKIENQNNDLNYTGREEKINILPRLIKKYYLNNQFEFHLQAYILENLEDVGLFDNIEWIGNEVSCGVGMQRIDIMLSICGKNKKVVPIELKSTEVADGITVQLQRYIDRIEQYFLSSSSEDIEPVIISREIKNKNTSKYKNLITSFNKFNSSNNILKLRYVEFRICDDRLYFDDIMY